MVSSDARGKWRSVVPKVALAALCASSASAQLQPTGFALERFYPSAPGAGWFVMDDLNISGGLGGAVSLTSGYARNPLEITNPGAPALALVSNEAFVDIGAAVSYSRFRGYLNIPIPLVVNGVSGTVGPYQLTAPSLSVGINPDEISDTRLGFDVRLLGKPEGPLRVGLGAQLIFPSGSRADYVSDGRYRGMFRFLAAGDAGGFTYAGQLGVHVRSLVDAPMLGGPNGSEFLFGIAAGRKFAVRPGWALIIGPEIFGETAFRNFFSGETGTEGLLTGRFEGTNAGPNLRFKLGAGHAFIHSFGTPEWRIVGSVELFTRR